MSFTETVAGRLPGQREERVPASALILSVLALLVAAVVNLVWLEAAADYLVLLWVLALIPPFLLAYYRGWQGASIALAAGMILLIGVEVGARVLVDQEIRWQVLGSFMGLLILVSLGAGMVAEKLHRKTSDALQLAYADALTGLPNRRVLDMFLQKEFEAARRGGVFSIVVFDLDGFKRLNDTRGHSVGDAALCHVARALHRNTRGMDLSGRLGGDEFLAILPGESALGARTFGERVRGATRTGDFDHVTISAGVATYEPSIDGVEQMLEAADRALYAAKEAGGDRVESYESGLGPPIKDEPGPSDPETSASRV